MNTPPAGDGYSRDNEQAFRRLVGAELDKRFRRGAHIELGSGVGIVFTAPDGGRWLYTVDNAGVLVKTAQ